MINSRAEALESIKNKTEIHSSTYKKFKIDLYTEYVRLHGPGTCKICSKELGRNNFKGLIKGFSECCSYKCTNILRYGVDNPNKSTSIREKIKQTLHEKYGVLNPGQIQEVKEKVKNTCIQKYGVKNISQTEEVKEKRKITNLEKYGSEYYSQGEEFNQKVRNTSVQKYGVNHFTQSDTYKQSVKKKQPVHYSQRNIRNFDNYNQNFMLTFVKDDKFDMVSAMEYFNVSSTILHRNFDIPKIYSKPETALSKLIPNVILCDRKLIKPLEIDLLCETYKFGIEYNGLMYHSSGKSDFFPNIDNDKHLVKTELVEAKGYQLFHIFENEYLDLDKRKIWESIIKNKLGLSIKIQARKCSIKEITSSVSKEFLENNHLQGNVNAQIKIGLFYEDDLISVMTFGKSRFNKKYQYELLRFCSKIGHSVIGAAGKLLSYFEKTYTPKSIISYANRRWSQGNVYEKLKFEFISYSAQNYFYFKPNENVLYSRNMFQKHKLSKVLENFNPELSETENMFNNGYRKIYDSGNRIYVKFYK